jgi:hypothetical protein
MVMNVVRQTMLDETSRRKAVGSTARSEKVLVSASQLVQCCVREHGCEPEQEDIKVKMDENEEAVAL